jgi:fibronectin type 3 domain-containing protein
MESNATKAPRLQAGFQTAVCRWNPMKRSILEVGLLVALSFLSASSALASFNATDGPYWPGRTDYYYGSTEITTAETLNNSGAMIYDTSTLPGDTGPLAFWSGNYYWGVGVLDWGADGATINNNSGGTIQSIVSGAGEAQGCGIVTLQAVTINNSGLIDGEVQNNDGVAFGVNQNSSGLTVTNSAGATISATSAYSATAINCANNVSIVNNGTITCTGYAGTEGATSNRAYAYTINTGGGSPIFFENNGILKAICPSTTATNNAQIFTCWNNNTNTFINTGLIYSENDSPIGYSFDLYYGIQGYDESFFNSGTISNFSVNSSGGWAVVWMENDADNGNYVIYNTGTMACNDSNINVLFAGGFGPSGNNYIYYTNTGTFNGGWLTLGFPGTVWEAGQILTTGYGLSAGSQMHVTGWPTINPTINGGGTNSTLDFNLVGTLQKINGTAASGTNFSGLSGSGSIVVSGKTYSWNNFSNGVSGTVSAAGYVPPPWQQQDIGAVGVAGGAVYTGGLLTLLASGSDIGGTADALHYVYQSMSNNCTVIAQVSLALNTNANAKAGVTIRDSLNANAANAFIGLMPGNRVVFQYRSSDAGGTSSNSVSGLSQSYWVKLAQSGTTLTGYYSVDGANWTQLGATIITGMGAVNYGGLAFDNNNNSTVNTATFAGVICTGGLLVPSVPTGVTATAGLEQVTLNWQAASNAAGYNIGRSTVSGGPYPTVASVITTNYTDLNVAGRTTYYYVVTAVTPGSQGTNSAQVSATPTANVPSPWAALDIGILAVAGSESCSNNSVFTVSASGSDYDASYTYTVNVSDDFRFVYATNTSGNCTLVARVASLQGGNGWSKAGVTIRDSLNAGAANVFIGMTPTTNGVVFEHRSSDGAMGSFDTNVTQLIVPCWVELVQSGSTFTGYYSTNGSSWTQLGTTTVSMGGTEYVGMAVCANDNGTGYYNNPVTTTFTATFDHVSAPGWPAATGPTGLTATATSGGQVNLKWNAVTNATGYNVKRSTVSGGPYSVIASGLTATNFTDSVLVVGINYDYVVSAIIGGVESANSAEATVNLPLPSPWVSLDVGTVGLTGSAGYGNNTFTVAGAGADIWGTADAFRFAYVPVTGNCTIMARVASLPNIDGWSKAGVMIRASTNASAANAFIAVTPGNGVTWQTRSSTGGASGNSATAGLSAPYWVKLVRSGNTFTGSYSPDGVTWTQQGTATFTMAATAYVGLALTSHNSSSLCTATFDNVTATGWSAPLPPPAPGGLAAAAVSSSQIALAWNAVTNAANYNVKRATTNGGPYTVVATGVTATNYNDTGLADGTPYFYVVSAVNVGGESTNSVQVAATTMPTAPAGLAAAAVSAGQISLTWNAVANATSYNIKRSTVSGGSYTVIATGVTLTNYTDAVPAGMKYYYVVSAVAGGVESLNSLEATVNLPYPWVSQDIGPVGMAGSAHWTNGVFTVTGGGPDILNPADAFRFVYVPVTGACTIIARVVSLTNGSDFSWTKSGIMIRGSLATNAANAFLGVSMGSGLLYQYRSSANASTSWTAVGGPSVPYWIELVWSASAGTFTYNYSPDGVNWTTAATESFAMPSNTVYVGLAVTSPYTNYLTTAMFDNVTAPGWANDTPPPPPTGLAAMAGTGQVVLTWTAARTATSYNVQRSILSGGPYALITNLTTTNFTDTGVVNGTNYYYVVSALNPAGESTNSAQVGATPLSQPRVGISMVGGNLVFSGTNGLANGTYRILSSTNLATPRANWTQAGSGSFDGNGNCSATNAINPRWSAQYYLLCQP